MKDYYYILGISRTASKDEIKKAYRKLSLKFHPDQNNGDKFWEARFRDIHEAYETLVDDEKRRIYDEKSTAKTNESTATDSQNEHSEFKQESSKTSYTYPPQTPVATKGKSNKWSRISKSIFLAVVLLSVLVKLSNAHEKENNKEEVNQLNGELQSITDTLQLCEDWRTYHINKIDTLNQLIEETKSTIYEDSITIKNYFSNHKMAVVCIATGLVSASVETDFSAKYPQTVKDLAGWGLVLAAGYYLFNSDEVNEVYNKSVDADNSKNQYYSEIGNYQENISKEKDYLEEINNIEATCQNRASTLRQQIESLK